MDGTSTSTSTVVFQVPPTRSLMGMFVPGYQALQVENQCCNKENENLKEVNKILNDALKSSIQQIQLMEEKYKDLLKNFKDSTEKNVWLEGIVASLTKENLILEEEFEKLSAENIGLEDECLKLYESNYYIAKGLPLPEQGVNSMTSEEANGIQNVTRDDKIKEEDECQSHDCKLQQEHKHFKCDLCEFKCKRNGHLKQHMTIHSTEKPFKCHFCSYVSRWKYALARHLAIHTTKYFKCCVCGVNCSRKDHAPFKCGECDFVCYKKVQLKNHLLKHKCK